MLRMILRLIVVNVSIQVIQYRGFSTAGQAADKERIIDMLKNLQLLVRQRKISLGVIFDGFPRLEIVKKEIGVALGGLSSQQFNVFAIILMLKTL